jgi:PAS domain S-box-containing protein
VLAEDGQPFPLDQLPGRRAIQEGKEAQATLRFRILATGEERWSIVKARPVFHDRGNVYLAINLFQDVTAIKQTEAALAAERERLRVTLSSIGDGVIATDTAGQVEFMNPVAEELTGWTQSDAVGKPVAEVFYIVNEVTREAVENPSVRALTEGVVIGLANHTLLIARNGVEHPIDDSGAPIRSMAGETIGAVLVFRDIAERRQTERTLQQAHAQTTEILESLGDAFYTLDQDWRFTYINRKAEEYWQRRRQDLLGKVIWEVFPQVVGTKPYDEHYRAVRERASIAFETISPVLNRWIEARMYPTQTSLSVYFHDISERKQAELEHSQLTLIIEQQRQHLKNILANVPGVVWEAWGQPDAANQRIDFVSDYVEQMLGYSTKEWLETPNFWLNIVHPEDHGRAAAEAAAIFAGKQQGISRFRWMTQDGRAIPVEAHSTVAYDESGQPLGMRGVTMDIGERIRAEEALRESEALYRTLMEAMPQFVWSITNEGQFRYCNKLCRDYTGVTVEEINQAGWGLIAHPDDLPTVFENWQRGLENGEAHETELRYRRNDGVYRWFVNRVVPVKDTDGKVVNWVGAASDIHERKLAEEERSHLLTQLEEQSRRLNDLIANVPGVVWESRGTTEPGGGKINFVSDYIVNLLGYPLENWLTIPDFHFSILHADDREHYIAQTEAIFASGRPGVVQFRWIAQDRSIVWVSSHQLPILDANGRAVGVRGVTIDVTARKQAEEAVRSNEERLRAVLEHMPIMLIATDEEGKCVVWNQECERLTGFSADDMLGIPNSQIVKRLYPQEDYRKRVATQWEQTAGNYRDWELNITAKDGTSHVTVWSDISYEFAVPGWANWAVGFDITARKRAEAAQRENDVRWRMALENMPIMLSVNDEAGNRLVWNREAERVTGFSAEEMANSKVRRELLYPDPDYRASLVEQIDSYGLDFRDLELRTTCKDGSVRIISWSNLSRRCPIPGWPDWALGVDVTERKLAEERLTRLRSVTAALSQALTPQEVAEVILSEVGAALNVRAGSVTMLDEHGDMLEIVHSVGYPPGNVEQWHRLSINAPAPLADAVRTATPIFVESSEGWHALYPQTPIPDTLGHQAWAAIPFIVNTRVLGGLRLAFDTPREFSAEERAFISALAHHCAQAFERARLYDTERQSRSDAEAAQKRLEFLAEASALLASSLDFEKTLERMAQLAVNTIADWCVIDVLEDDGALHRVAVAHINPEKQEPARQLQDRYPVLKPDQQHTTLKVIRADHSWFDPDVSQTRLASEARDDEHLRMLQELGFESEIVVSLNAHGKLIGAITLVLGDSGRRYSQSDLELAEELARRAAVAVDNARLYRQAQEARADAVRAAVRTTWLQEVTAALSQALTTDQISEVIISQGLESLGAFAGSLYTVVGEELQLVRAMGYAEPLLDQWRLFPLSSAAPLADAVRTREAIWLESDSDRAAQYPEIARTATQQNGSWGAIPLIVEDEAIGGLGLSFATPRKFSEEDRAFALALAQQCAQSLERARLYEAVEREQQRQTFLAEATAMLASSLDYQLTLQSVALLAVPLIADWCVIHVMSDDGASIEQVVVAHNDPDKTAWAEELQHRYPSDPNSPRGIWNVLRTGQPEFFPVITDAMLQASSRDEDHLTLIRRVGFSSGDDGTADCTRAHHRRALFYCGRIWPSLRPR